MFQCILYFPFTDIDICELVQQIWQQIQIRIVRKHTLIFWDLRLLT